MHKPSGSSTIPPTLMKTRTLIAIPTKPNTPASLMADSLLAEARLFAENSNGELVPGRDCAGKSDIEIKTLAERVYRNAIMRNLYLERYLTRDITHVMWIDADVISYPADLVRQLLAISDVDIVAPAVYLQRHNDRWYDIAGFVENGQWCRLMPPHFAQKDDVVTLDSVGCVYLVPSFVYFLGGRYQPSDRYAEHHALCQYAREKLRMQVLCATKIRTEHAFLADYGERLH